MSENGYFYPQTPQSPRPLSPETPRQRNSQILSGDRRMSEDYMGTVDSGGGLGNLADELADAWGDGEGYEDASGFEANGQAENMEGFHEDEDTSGQGTPREPVSPDQGNGLQPPRSRARQTQNRHRRNESQYDGSDYGNDSDFDELGELSPNLERRMAGIESLARRGIEENGSSTDQIINRFIESLRDLGAQSAIENGAAR
jgi:hypothetical protein